MERIVKNLTNGTLHMAAQIGDMEYSIWLLQLTHGVDYVELHMASTNLPMECSIWQKKEGQMECSLRLHKFGQWSTP